MEKILLTGSNGQLGSSIIKLLKNEFDIIATSKTHHQYKNYSFDITNKVLCNDVISIHDPDIIINLASLTNVDFCEENPGLSMSVNVGGVQNLLDAFKRKIIHISTDYVFDGKSGPYKEKDEPNPINIYGLSKLAGERAVLSRSNNLVIRTNILYDYNENVGASFFNWVIKNLKNKKPINVVDDQFGNPTWVNSLVVAIYSAINKDITGTLHWADSDYLSRFDFALKIAEMYDLDKKLILPIKTSELNQIADRPLKGGLDIKFSKNILKLEAPTIEECLKMIKIDK